MSEYSRISEKEKLFKEFNGLLISNELDFSKLTANEFEKLCFELLTDMGFLNVKMMGKTNAPDGGVDIIAEQKVDGILGPYVCKYIFQCKHSKKTLNRKDISEISLLLKEHKADKYCLLCSNSISPDAIFRMQNQSQSNEINWYGKTELENILSNKYPKLINKYFKF